jgi:hypothetical protein
VHCDVDVQGTHIEETHTSPLVQLELSVHPDPHTPALQTWPVGQSEVPVHEPHVPLTQPWPAGQSAPVVHAPHVPETHACPDGHCVLTVQL